MRVAMGPTRSHFIESNSSISGYPACKTDHRTAASEEWNLVYHKITTTRSC